MKKILARMQPYAFRDPPTFLGATNYRLSVDDRIVALAQQLPLSYDEVAQVLQDASVTLGWTIDQCIRFANNNLDRLRLLHYCAVVTKQHRAVNYSRFLT